MEIRSGVFCRLKSTRSFKRIELSHIRTHSAFHYGHEVSFIAPGAFYVQWHAGRGRKLVEIRSSVFCRLKSTRSFKRIELSHIRTHSAFHYGHEVSFIAPGAFYVQWHAGRGRKLVEICSGVFCRLKSTRSFKRIELSHTRCAFHYGHEVSPIAPVGFYIQ